MDMFRIISFTFLFFHFLNPIQCCSSFIEEVLKCASYCERVNSSIELAIFPSLKLAKEIHQLGNFEIPIFLRDYVDKILHLMVSQLIFTPGEYSQFGQLNIKPCITCTTAKSLCYKAQTWSIAMKYLGNIAGVGNLL